MMRSRAPSKTLAAAAVISICLALAANAQTQPGEAPPSNLVVIVLDESLLPVPGANVVVKQGDQVIFAGSTNEAGRAEFPGKPEPYNISADKEGFELAVVKDFDWKPGAGGTVELTLKPAASR